MAAGASGWKYWVICAIAFAGWKLFFSAGTPTSDPPPSPVAAVPANPFDQFDAVAEAGPAARPGPNYATCILENMPGAPNEAFTNAVVQKCLQAHAGSFYEIELGSGKGLLAFADAQACIVSKAGATTNERGAFLIASACRCLYGSPSAPHQRCAYRPPGPPT